MIWSREETLSRQEIEFLQLDRLKETVYRVYEKVPYYKEKMDAIGMKPENVKSLDDLKKLPFTTKQDMRDTYPFGLFAVDKSELARIHASSGTTGKPTVVGYTKKDLDVWSECVARLAVMGGATKEELLVKMLGEYDTDEQTALAGIEAFLKACTDAGLIEE